jgi:hypothetical protein
MVPQVEVQHDFVCAWAPPPPGLSPEKRKEWHERKPEVLHSRKEWRDATWLDLQAMPSLTAGNPDFQKGPQC